MSRLNFSKRSIDGSMVQFFHSESSFHSDDLDLTTNGFLELKQDILLEADSIFKTLRQCLIPRQQINSFDQIEHIIHRASILFKETMPDILIAAKKKKIIQTNEEFEECSQRLQTLLHDYRSYQNSEISFDIFFNRYGSPNKCNDKLGFGKKDSETIVFNIQGDEVQIVDNGTPLQYRSSNNPNNNLFKSVSLYGSSSNFKGNNTTTSSSEKQLKQELLVMKQKQKQLNKLHKAQLLSLTKHYNNRIKNIIEITHSKSDENWDGQSKINEELVDSNKRIEQLLIELEQQRSSHQKLEQHLKKQNQNKKTILKELQNFRKIYENNQNSDISKISELQNEGNLPKKAKKLLLNLTDENFLLKKQLGLLNESHSKVFKFEESRIANQNVQLTRMVKQLQKDQHDTAIKMDRLKIQNLTICNQKNQTVKLLQFAKHQVQAKQLLGMSVPGFSGTLERSSESTQQKDIQMNQIVPLIKYFIRDNNSFGCYEEFSPVYQVLNKQLKIRYKRSCLKQKELLFKNQNMEIGIITQFTKPNYLRVILHFSNFGGKKISNLKFKPTNSNGNIIQIDKKQIELLPIGEQKKLSMKIIIRNYPIGSTTLSYTYQYVQQKGIMEEKMQIPMNIIKTISISSRDGDFVNPKTKKLKIQRKIVKQFKSLCQYFDEGKVNKQQKILSMSIYHNHTETKLLIDFREIQKITDNPITEYEITYEHRAGKQEITQNIVRNLLFLFSKEQI